jgi:hypothetical protein
MILEGQGSLDLYSFLFHHFQWIKASFETVAVVRGEVKGSSSGDDTL